MVHVIGMRLCANVLIKSSCNLPVFVIKIKLYLYLHSALISVFTLLSYFKIQLPPSCSAALELVVAAAFLDKNDSKSESAFSILSRT